MPGKPYLPLYVGDWRKDPAVQSLTYEERGVWMELLFFMHECPDRGRLVVEGKDLEGNETSVPIAMPELARMLGLTPKEALCIIGKLMAKGVAGYDSEEQVLYNRRMVREQDLSRKRREAGLKGAAATWGQADGKGIGKTDGKGDGKDTANSDNENDIDNDKVVIDVKKGKKYSGEFEMAWGIYPSRGKHSNPKNMAYEQWCRRLKEGITVDSLIKATKAYNRECHENQEYGTKSVMQARTFFGPNSRWEEYLEKYDDGMVRDKKLAEDIVPAREVSDEERVEQIEEIRKAKKKLEDRHGKSDNDSGGEG